MKHTMLKMSLTLGTMAFAVVMALPAQALIYNWDVADNAGIAYSKLSLNKKITSKDIKNETIQSKDIKNSTISSKDIKNGTIKSDDIKNGTITEDDIAAGTLTVASLADGSVTSAKILDGTIVAADIATGAVATAEILDGTIAGADLATNIAITTSGVGTFTGNVSLGDGGDDVVIDATLWSVDALGQAYFDQVLVTGDATALDGATLVFEGATGDEFETFLYAADPTADNEIIFPNVSGTVVTTGDTATVTSLMIAVDTIAAVDIAVGGVATSEILDETILSADIFDGTITAADLGADSVAASELADSSVDTGAIIDATIIGGDLNAAIAITTTGTTTLNGVTVIGDGGDNASIDSTSWGITTGGGVIGLTGITGTMITDGTIGGSDLAAAIAISTNGSVTTTAGGTITSAGLMTASGGLTVVGDLLATPQSAAATAAEGVVYYDSDDDNLYVYAGGGWVDLTAGAAGAVTLDDAYNASAGASTVLVDNGDLTLQSNAGATGDIIVNLASTGDFILQDNGADVITFSDSGNLTMASGVLDVNAVGAITLDGTTASNFTVTGAAESLTLAVAGGGAQQLVLSSAGTGAGDAIDMNATAGGLDADINNAITIDSTLAGISLDGVTSSNFTVTGAAADLTLSSVGGSVNVSATESAADSIDIQSTAGGIDIRATGAAAGEDIDIVATGSSVNLSSTENAADAMVLTTSAGGMQLLATGAAAEDILLTNTGGSVVITATEAAADAIVLNASVGGMDISANDDIDITLVSGAAAEDLTIQVTGAFDASLLLASSGTGTDAIGLNASAGGIDIDAASNIVLDPTNGGAGALLPETDSEDDIGADATRWSTIFADTLNYSAALTDGGVAVATTVVMGNDSAADTVTIIANTAITDAQWSITAPGVATFAGIDGPIGGVTPSTASFTTITLANSETISNAVDAAFLFHRNDAGTVTITASDNDAIADLIVAPGSTGAMTLGSGTATAITLSTDGSGTAEVVLPAGSIDSTEILDETIVSADIDDGTIAGGDLATNIAISTTASVATTGVGTITSAGLLTASNGLTATTGTVDFSGATTKIDVVASLTNGGTCAAAGDVGKIVVGDTAAAADAVLLICEETVAGTTYAWTVR